jgi:hypothetical protein
VPARAFVLAGAVIGATSAAWLAGDVLAGHMTLIVDFARTTNPLVRAWRTMLPDGLRGGDATGVLRVAWVVVVAFLAWWGVRSVRAPAATTEVAATARFAALRGP